ncbi:MAG: helix-turn-helix domain-containing protein [Proteobacteria bacterium]|nr:helix-turn-helix domain-containing protein [Pseudomonadota bacterium]
MRVNTPQTSDCPADVFSAQCPSRRVLELLAEKWALLVVHRLAGGPARTAALRRSIGGISEKMLIQTLRRLEQHGFVVRRAFAEVPPRVEYELTPLGASLSEPIRALDRWVEVHHGEIDAARRAYQERAGRS